MLMPTIWGENFFDDFFEDFKRPVKQVRPAKSFLPATVMKTDIVEREDEFALAVDLPGYTKEDVKLQLREGFLTVSASSITEDSESDAEGRFVRKERFCGSCSRSFFVGEDITQEDIKAKFENGVLKINVPKKMPEPKVEENFFIPIQD